MQVIKRSYIMRYIKYYDGVRTLFTRPYIIMHIDLFSFREKWKTLQKREIKESLHKGDWTQKPV